MICFDCNTLNQILDDSKNRKVYAKVDSHFNLVGPALIEVLNDELKLYGIVYYENGKINGDSYIFSASQDFEPLLVHFNNNTIDIIYEYVIGKNHVYDEASGRRWEGDVCIQKDGKQVFFPFGEGCEYDEANAMGFVGFRFGTERNGFGTSYWNSVKSSEGFFINGNNYGTCSLYDRKGSYLYTVMMIDGDVYMQAGDCDFERMDCSMTTLMHTFSDKFTSLPSPLLFHSFSLLREVIIPSALQSSCTFVSFTYLPLLQKIQLGNACFSQESIVIPPYTPGMAQTIRQQGKQLVIADCPCLSSITMGPFACSDFCYLTVQSYRPDLPELKEMTFGSLHEDSYCFYHSEVFRCTNTPQLKKVVFGGFSFYWCSQVSLSNDHFVRIVCGESALERCAEFHCDYRSEAQLDYQYPSFRDLR